MKFGIRQTAISSGVFAILLLGLSTFDERVRERATDVFWSASDVSTWDNRVRMLVDAIGDAVRHQSIENAPLLIFATVGAVLFLFMVRT